MPCLKCVASVALALLVFAGSAFSQTIVLNTSNSPPNASKNHDGICDKVMTEAFRRMGMTLSINYLPSERALINANDGLDDGNYARVEGIETLYPNLVRVPEEIAVFKFTAFSRKVSFKLSDWDSLNPYNIGIVIGWKILENNIRDTKSLTIVRNSDILFNLLLADKVDVVVYDRRQGEVDIKKLGAKNIKVLAPPLTVKSMFPYLHKRYKDLAPKLAQTIRAMKKDGTYNRIVAEVLRSYSVKE